MKKSPDAVTLRGAADLLSEYLRESVRLVLASGRDDLRARVLASLGLQTDDDGELEPDSPALVRALKGGITVRQVRYMAEAISSPVRPSSGPGDSQLLDAVEIGFLAMILQCRLLQISGGARLWAGMASHAPEIRSALRHPSPPMGLSIDWRGRVSVLPLEDAEADADAYVFDLAGTREIIDALIAARRRTQPWEWAQWRKTPAKELRAMA